MSGILLTERHAKQMGGVLGCYDRILIFGTLPGICYAGGMTSFLYSRQVRIFDYPKPNTATKIAASNSISPWFALWIGTVEPA